MGHNLLVCILVGAVVACLDYRYDLASRGRELAGRLLPVFTPKESSQRGSTRSAHRLCVWIATGVLASLGHLAADLVFSGHAVFSDWGLQLFWPFSDRVWVYPLVPWGDPSVTVIFAVGMFGMIRWPARLQLVAALTLALVLGYVGIRGVIAG